MEHDVLIQLQQQCCPMSVCPTTACPPSNEEEQSHTHEFLGSTKLAEECDERHNHRFAGVSSQAIPANGDHIHIIHTNTDFFDHLHEVGVQTGTSICVGNGKHVHFAVGFTTLDDGHVHEFQFATLIDSPLIPVND